LTFTDAFKTRPATHRVNSCPYLCPALRQVLPGLFFGFVAPDLSTPIIVPLRKSYAIDGTSRFGRHKLQKSAHQFLVMWLFWGLQIRVIG
jgi:hypothetical protein